MDDDKPYIPNEYTNYVSIADWRKVVHGEPPKTAMPNTEPNSLPSVFYDREDWRETYKAYVEEFKVGPKTYSDEVLLKIRLRRIGFGGINLNREIEFIKEN